MRRSTILVVDDEPPMRRYLSANLKASGYEVLLAADGTEALDLLTQHSFDLVILDIMLPGPDGLEVLQRLRRDQRVPVIVVSARGREDDKVIALDFGADDYLTKPFNVEELLARVRAQLRRAAEFSAASPTVYRSNDLEIDLQARRVRRSGTDIQLTRKEYDIIALLAHNAGKVLTHRQILQAVWGPEYGDEVGYLWTHIGRIRSKLEPDPESPRFVVTEIGVGYSMPNDEAER
jgi:two-component system KDP operon response regulator KdpE